MALAGDDVADCAVGAQRLPAAASVVHAERVADVFGDDADADTAVVAA